MPCYFYSTTVSVINPIAYFFIMCDLNVNLYMRFENSASYQDNKHMYIHTHTYIAFTKSLNILLDRNGVQVLFLLNH